MRVFPAQQLNQRQQKVNTEYTVQVFYTFVYLQVEPKPRFNLLSTMFENTNK